MARVKDKTVEAHAKASMGAFGKGKQPIKGPVNRKKLPLEPDADDGAAPGTFRPHKEPDADDMMPFKKKGKVGAGAAKSGPGASSKIKAGKAGNMPEPFKKGKKEKIR